MGSGHGSTETTTYDGDGVRVGQQVGTDPATAFVNDVATPLPIVLDDGTRTYVWGPTGIAWAVEGTDLEVYHADRLGSVRAITDAGGAVTATFRTDEFGLSTASTGSSDQPFGFTGEPETGSGLIHLRARTYDPALGRFLSRDTWPGSPVVSQTQNRYSYVGNNPAAQADPSGHCGVDIIADVAFAGVSAAMLVFGPEKDRGTNALALGADLTSIAIPCATGLGMIVRAGKAVDAVGDAASGIRVVDGMRLSTSEAMDLAHDFLGPGYRDLGDGRFLSPDGLRQVRMGDGDILGAHGGGPHINFETLVPKPGHPGKLTRDSNLHVYLTDAP